MSSLSVTITHTFLLIDDLDSFGATGHVFYKILPYWNLSDIWLWQAYEWGVGNQDLKCCFYQIISKIVPTWSMTMDVDLDHVAKVGFATLLQSKVFLSILCLSALCSLEGDHHAQLTPKKWEIMLFSLRSEYLLKYLEFFIMEDLSLSNHSIICSIIYFSMGT